MDGGVQISRGELYQPQEIRNFNVGRIQPLGLRQQDFAILQERLTFFPVRNC